MHALRLQISQVIVYLNWVLGFMNLYFLMPLDSVLNDLCLAVVSFSAPTSDVQDAKRAEVADLALTIFRVAILSGR